MNGKQLNKQEGNHAESSRFARGMAEGAPGTARCREGLHAPTRCADAPPNGDALGARGEVLSLRGAEWRSLARRSLRRALPADRLSLHVRPRLGRGVHVMLLLGRQLQRHPDPSQSSRCDAYSRVASSLVKIEAYRKRMGWSFPWVSSYGSDFNRDYNVSFTA